MSITVFNRYEHKYILNEQQYREMLKIIEKRMSPDKYNKDGKLYTISNLYYDTADDELIKRSLDKPIYKEKLRLRAYGVPDISSTVFLEIKKKYKKTVNKRRISLPLCDAYSFMSSNALKDGKITNSQIFREICYFKSIYKLMPKAYIAYDRLAFFENQNSDLRISFDKNIRTRRFDLHLEKGDYGYPIIDNSMWLMEVKTSMAKPVWLCDALAGLGIFKTSFSKYGTEYLKYKNLNNLKAVI